MFADSFNTDNPMFYLDKCINDEKQKNKNWKDFQLHDIENMFSEFNSFLSF